MLFFTQTGKVIHREQDSLELSKSALAKGQALISPARLEQGVRFIGAASVRGQTGSRCWMPRGISKSIWRNQLPVSGSIEAEGLILSIGVIPAEAWKDCNP